MNTAEDYFVLYNMIKTGDVKKAQLFLSKAVKQHRKLMHERQMQQVEAQSMANGKAAVMAEQEKAKTMQMKLQGDLAKISAQGEQDRLTIEFQATFDMERDKGKDKRNLGGDMMKKAIDAQITGVSAEQQQQQQQQIVE